MAVWANAFFQHGEPSFLWMGWLCLSMLMIGHAVGLITSHRERCHWTSGMEQIRRQIAQDLHDDIGSGLSQIAIWSELAKEQIPSERAAFLDEMASLARTLRQSMSDIVWAIDPRNERLSELLHRMRAFAFSLPQHNDLRLVVQVPPCKESERVHLAPDELRHMLLFFKEAVTNALCHAEANQIRISVMLEAGKLLMTIGDNGRGFDPSAVQRGRGLYHLQDRARALEAEVTIESEIGEGTTVALMLPLTRSSRHAHGR